MKRFTILAALIAFVGCSQYSEELDKITAPTQNQTEFFASMPECETRTYVEDNKYLRWNAGDEITIFNGNSYNSHWKFAGENGANSGKFTDVEENGFVTGTPLNLTANYAIYPYNENITITESGVVSLTLPATQAYNRAYANSFGAGANTMMAVTENASDNFLAFKNLCGYLKLKFYGEDVTVKSVTIKGNNSEKIAGNAIVTMAYGSEPTITMGNDATDTITIDCGEGVALSNDAANPTIFWVVIPETTFKGGITITVTDTNDQTFTKATTNAVPITNNLIQPMAALGVESIESTPPNNQIWYTATKTVTPYEYAQNAFNVPWIESVFNEETGKGVITFNGDLTKIGSNAFYYNRALTSITLPNSCVELDANCFADCENLQCITFGNNMQKINASGLFRNCGKLSCFKGEQVADDGHALIINNEMVLFAPMGLEQYNIPEGVTSIGKYAFNNAYLNSNLTTISIPNTAKLIKQYAFANIDVGTIHIGNSITQIEDFAFYNSSNITSICLPNSIVSIGDSVFDRCRKLENINLPEGLLIIGNDAFSETNLTSIVIPNSVIEIGVRCFDGCKNLKKVTLPDNIAFIPNYMFYGCSSLSDITIPNGVKSIGERAFYGCSKWSNITIPKGIEKFGGYSFAYCQGDIVINSNPVSLKTNGTSPDASNSIFYKSSFNSIQFGKEVTTIGAWAFYNCNITEISIPSSITTIGGYAFAECSLLEYVSLPDGITLIPQGLFNKCKKLKIVNIPATVESIEQYAFNNCALLSSIVIPTGVISIGASAFEYCSGLTSITIPQSVTSIGRYAFYDCSMLGKVYCMAITPPKLEYRALPYNYSGNIYVPVSDDDSIISSYKNADGWIDYATYITEYNFE